MKEQQLRQDAMNMNFFDWLRDGVRQSVIMGVSDAVEQLGTPENSEKINPELAGILGEPAKKTTTKRRRVSGSGSSRKRLGRSLQDMDSTSK
ncbi:MAG: hypothetical protein AAGD07_11115 [Planctomycetota bacterium]